jgi:hypothetical protein
LGALYTLRPKPNFYEIHPRAQSYQPKYQKNPLYSIQISKNAN